MGNQLMKFKVVELIPYSTFKERLKIIKQYDKKAKVEILKNYIYVERTEFSETTKQEKKILEKLGVGRENALKAHQLGEERDVRYIVSSLRKKKYPICSGDEGYWIARTEIEKTESLGKINSRIKELTAVAEGLKKARAYETVRDNN